MAAGRETAEAERIQELFERFRPVADADAKPNVKALFEDIRATLRVPFVGAPFRMLANDPALLESWWSAVRGPLGLRYAEREADRLRTHALFVVPPSEMGALHRSQLHRMGLDERTVLTIGQMQATVHYGLPRVHLAVAAGALALRGDVVGGARLHREDDARPLEHGVAPDTVTPDPIALESAPAPVRQQLEELRTRHGHPVVSPWFLAMARYPPYLERVMDDLPVLLDSARYRPAAATLATLAEVAAKGFPSPVKVEARGEVIPRGDAEALLRVFHERLMPELLLDCAYLRALLDGERRARTSRYSITA